MAYLHINTLDNVEAINSLLQKFLSANRFGYNANNYITNPLEKKAGGWVIPLPDEYSNEAILNQFMYENESELHLFGGTPEEINENITENIKPGVLKITENDLLLFYTGEAEPRQGCCGKE